MCSDYKNATPEQVCIQLKRHLYKPMVGFLKTVSLYQNSFPISENIRLVFQYGLNASTQSVWEREKTQVTRD